MTWSSLSSSAPEPANFFPTASISRRAAATRDVGAVSRNPVQGCPLPDSDPYPKPRRVVQYLAFGFIVFLTMLQFRSPTHFRDPSNPLLTWIPVGSTLSYTSSEAKRGSLILSDLEKMHVISWMDCLDIRMLSVLINSILSNSRYPDNVHFHIFTPDGHKDKVSFYKLKVLLPHSNLEFIGQDKLKQKLQTAILNGEYARPLSLHEVVPFAIPATHPFLKRFIYVQPDIIMKGRIEEIFGLDLGIYAIAVAEDCSMRLHEYVNYDILNAIQRSATKPWLSSTPYAKDACIPDPSMLLINSDNLEYDLVEAILWWSKVLPKGIQRPNQSNPAFMLPLYDKYFKLPSVWKVPNGILPEANLESNLLSFDGPRKACSSELETSKLAVGNLWEQYLPKSPDHILLG